MISICPVAHNFFSSSFFQRGIYELILWAHVSARLHRLENWAFARNKKGSKSQLHSFWAHPWGCSARNNWMFIVFRLEPHILRMLFFILLNPWTKWLLKTIVCLLGERSIIIKVHYFLCNTVGKKSKNHCIDKVQKNFPEPFLIKCTACLVRSGYEATKGQLRYKSQTIAFSNW